jgi:hypothetical protein
MLVYGLLLVIVFYGLYYCVYLLPSSRPVFVYNIQKKTPRKTVRLYKEGGITILIDTETRIRTNPWKERLINPFFLNERELLNRAEIETVNPWSAFQKLYLLYYADFYEKRMDKKISFFDREVNIAYKYWKRKQQ